MGSEKSYNCFLINNNDVTTDGNIQIQFSRSGNEFNFALLVKKSNKIFLRREGSSLF